MYVGRWAWAPIGTVGRSVGRTVERTRPPLGEMVVVVATTIVLWVVSSSEKGGELEEGWTIRREKTTSESETGSCFRNAPLPLSFPFLSLSTFSN